jgi:hypothetical protein
MLFDKPKSALRASFNQSVILLSSCSEWMNHFRARLVRSPSGSRAIGTGTARRRPSRRAGKKTFLRSISEQIGEAAPWTLLRRWSWLDLVEGARYLQENLPPRK